MGTVISVMADSKAEAADELARWVERGYVPLAGGRVMEVPGRGGRWMARAVPAEEPIPAPVRPVSLRKLLTRQAERAAAASDGQQRQPGRTCTLPNEAS